MGADLHIHIVGTLTEQDFKILFSHSLGSKYFDMSAQNDFEEEQKVWERVSENPEIWIGEVSWLKASLTEDKEKYIPSTVMTVSELIGENQPILDEELKSSILAAFDLANSTQYDLASKKEVEEWLDKNMGERLFTISW